MPYTNLACGYVSAFILGGVSFTPPATYYASLSATQPTQTSSGLWGFTEPTAGVGGFARAAVVNSTSNFGPVSVEPVDGYQITNKQPIAFSPSTAAWSSGATPLEWFGLFDAATPGTGNLWLFGQCSVPYVVNGSGVVPTIVTGQFFQSVV